MQELIFAWYQRNSIKIRPYCAAMYATNLNVNSTGLATVFVWVLLVLLVDRYVCGIGSRVPPQRGIGLECYYIV